jgi:hypothetical protein
VEAGNVGQHYYAWRYQSSAAATTAQPTMLAVSATTSTAMNTGVSVLERQRLDIRVTGNWCIGGADCSGPDGYRDADPDLEQPLLLPSAKIGALIGTISAEGVSDPRAHDWFVIGSGGQITAHQGGSLYVMFNDLEVNWPQAFTDNSGVLTVRIERP